MWLEFLIGLVPSSSLSLIHEATNSIQHYLGTVYKQQIASLATNGLSGNKQNRRLLQFATL